MSPCDFGTKGHCLEPATVAVSIDGLPDRPMCRRHALVWVGAVAGDGDSMALQIRDDPDDPDDR